MVDPLFHALLEHMPSVTSWADETNVFPFFEFGALLLHLLVILMGHGKDFLAPTAGKFQALFF